jgi:hypothetical protein
MKHRLFQLRYTTLRSWLYPPNRLRMRALDEFSQSKIWSSNEVSLVYTCIPHLCYVEDLFFQEARSSQTVNLQKGHPLTHLITSFQSIKQHSTEHPLVKNTSVRKGPYNKRPVLVESKKKKMLLKANETDGGPKSRLTVSKDSKLHREFLMSTYMQRLCLIGYYPEATPKVGRSSKTPRNTKLPSSLGSASPRCSALGCYRSGCSAHCVASR